MPQDTGLCQESSEVLLGRRGPSLSITSHTNAAGLPANEIAELMTFDSGWRSEDGNENDQSCRWLEAEVGQEGALQRSSTPGPEQQALRENAR
ncbi:hypothetical protein D3C86_1476260 [compost metagenome]